MSAAAAGRARKRPGVEEQRKVILDAAVALFAARGTSATSVSDICKRAGVSRDTYYRCFSDKAALIRQLYQTSVNEHMEAVIGATDLAYDDPDWLHKVCDQTIDSILEQRRVAQFLFVESADSNSVAYQVIHTAYDRVARRMQRWCKARYGQAPSREYFKALLVAAQWLVHDAIIKGMGERDIANAKRSAELLFHGAFSALEK